MRARSAIALAACLAAAMIAPPAGATELHYGGKVEGIYTNNVFGSTQNPQDDGSFRATPEFQLLDRNGNFTWHLEYDPSYEQFVTLTDLSGWDQDVNGHFSWRIGPLATLRVSDRFGQFHSFSRFNQTVGIPGGGTAVEAINQRKKFFRNDGSISLAIRPSETQVLTLYGNHTLWNFSNQNGRDQQTIVAGARFLQEINPRLRLGSDLSWSHQYFASFGFLPSQETDYYHVGGVAIYEFDPTMEISVSAGPTLVVPPSSPSPPSAAIVPVIPLQEAGTGARLIDVTKCPTLSDGTPILLGCGTIPVFIPDTNPILPVLQNSRQIVFFQGPVVSSSGSNLTYFANAELTKQWENWQFSLTYSRQANQSAGVGTNSISDVVYGSLGWHPSARWSLSLNAAWIRRTQQALTAQTVLGLQPVDLSTCGTGAAVYPQCALVNFPNAAETAVLRSVKLSNALEFTTYQVTSYVDYRFTKRITLYAYAGWNRNARSGSQLPTEYSNIFTFWTGIRYAFEPIHF